MMLKALFKFLRLPNLIIVGISQYLLLYCLLIPYLSSSSITLTLDHLHFFLFVLNTILITLTGNIINDIKDHPIDLINRPHSVFVSKYITVQNARRLYKSVVFIGFIEALYLAIYIDKIPLVFIYPIAVLLLYLYSTRFKQKAIIGNIIVGLFCAGVTAIVLFAEKDAYFQLDLITQKKIGLTFTAYGIFAYLTTMFREIVKDMEDMKGDAQRGCRTLPIIVGIPKTKFFAFIHGIGILPLLLIISVHLYNTHQSFILYISPILFILIPMSYLLHSLYRANTPPSFHKISSFMKFIMLMGLLYLPLYAWLYTHH